MTSGDHLGNTVISLLDVGETAFQDPAGHVWEIAQQLPRPTG
jgi:hypothetical protein